MKCPPKRKHKIKKMFYNFFFSEESSRFKILKIICLIFIVLLTFMLFFWNFYQFCFKEIIIRDFGYIFVNFSKFSLFHQKWNHYAALAHFAESLREYKFENWWQCPSSFEEG